MEARRQFWSVLLAVGVSACVTTDRPSEPTLDHLEGAADPVFQPMLVVPLPDLASLGGGSGEQMEALQASNTPLGDVLLTLFKDSDINLVVDPEVQAVDCTFDIKHATVEEAFDALLKSLDLAYEWDGNFLRVQDSVNETITVDLIDSGGQNNGGGGQGGGGQGGGGQGGNSTQTSFWEEIEASLPVLLGTDATFVVNRTASAIHVQGRPSAVRRLREVVDATMGRANRQVSLEARVLEVRLENEFSLGINWSLLPGLFNSNKTGLGAGGGVVSQAAASGGSALTFGILDNNDFSVLVDALQQQGQVRVLSSPRVSTLNNQSASIAVTDQIPYIVRDVFTQEGIARTEFSIEFVEAGVLLNVRPLIGEDGLLSVTITPSVREQIGTVVTPDGLVSVPVVSERQATTTVRVADGQAIALGGLRSTRKNETRQGVPWLMDIPWAGQLFSNTVQERVEVELMIMLVPRVLDDTWINEEIQRGSHRLVQLRRNFRFNPINLEHSRPEDWSGGSLHGKAQAPAGAGVRMLDVDRPAMAVDAGLTVTRRGLAAHHVTAAAGMLAEGESRDAIGELELALQLDPSRLDALVTLGVLCERKGDRGRARRYLDRALRADGDDVLALTARGMLEMDSDAPVAARRYFERAHALGATVMTAANLGAAFVALGKNEDVVGLLQPLAADPRAPAELYANLAYAQLRLGMLGNARSSLMRAYGNGADSKNPRIAALDRMIRDAVEESGAMVGSEDEGVDR